MVHPEVGEIAAGRAGLGDLVLVVRERQLGAAAVDVERSAQVAARHRRALEVPAGAAAPHGVGQEAVAGSVGLCAFHSAKSRGSRLRSAVSVSSHGLHVVEALPRQRAIVGIGADVEVHVPLARRTRGRRR